MTIAEEAKYLAERFRNLEAAVKLRDIDDERVRNALQVAFQFGACFAMTMQVAAMQQSRIKDLCGEAPGKSANDEAAAVLRGILSSVRQTVSDFEKTLAS